MADHTPLPWTADPDDRTGYEWNFHIVEASNPDRRICFMTSDGPSEANAAYIVRACNAYPELVKALERIADMEPATQELTLAHTMAAEAREALNLVERAQEP